MPLPALPVLTATARFILAKGTREAVKKYGRAAVTKAKELIKKRDKAIDKKRRQLPPEERGLPEEFGGDFQRSPAEQRAVDIRSGVARRTRSLRTQAEGEGGEYVPKEEIPLKLKKGGKVRGAGRAIRGVRPCKMY